MVSKSEWNRTVWPAWAEAQRAADELMVVLPDSPPKPAWPYRPFSPRAVAWFGALIRAADHAGDPRISNARDRLRLALEQVRALGTPPLTADVKEAFAWFHDVVGNPPLKDMTTEAHLAALLADGRLTVCQAAGWRVILGMPETARAQGDAG